MRVVADRASRPPARRAGARTHRRRRARASRPRASSARRTSHCARANQQVVALGEVRGRAREVVARPSRSAGGPGTSGARGGGASSARARAIASRRTLGSLAERRHRDVPRRRQHAEPRDRRRPRRARRARPRAASPRPPTGARRASSRRGAARARAARDQRRQLARPDRVEREVALDRLVERGGRRCAERVAASARLDLPLARSRELVVARSRPAPAASPRGVEYR